MNPIGRIRPDATTLLAHRVFSRNQRDLAGSMERLATGQRINRAADDPAGLITSENLRATLEALEAESRSLQRTDHVIATADGALDEVSSMLNEAEALVVANAGGGLSAEERAANQMQIDSLVNSVNRIASTTTFNGRSLLDGTATVTAGDESLTIDDVHLDPIGEGEAAQTALAAARSRVTTTRASLGAMSRNTIGTQVDAIGVAMENIAAAESTSRDTDYGRETANLARLQVLTESSMRALGLSSAMAGRVLRLLA